jgi:hypothetical protein
MTEAAALGDRVHVDAGGRVHPGRHGTDPGVGQAEGGVVLLERPQVAQVEDCPEVDVEALGPLAGEDLSATGERVDRRRRQCRVVRGGQRPDVARRARQVGAENLRLAVGHASHAEELAAVPARGGQGRDRPGVVQEGVGVGDLARESELVGDLGLAVPVVVDVDRIQHITAELVEVGPSVRTLQRQVVGDDGHRVGIVGTHERVQVGAVGNRILGDLRCFTVGRHGITSEIEQGHRRRRCATVLLSPRHP